MHKDHFERQLKKEGALPAPGQYGSIESRLDASMLQSVTSKKLRGGSAQRYSLLENPNVLDETQTSVAFKSIHSTIAANRRAFSTLRNTNMEKIGKSLTSTIRKDLGCSFGLANDRFKAPTMKKQSPSPQAYQISDSIGYDDNYRQSPYMTKKVQRTRFGRENRE